MYPRVSFLLWLWADVLGNLRSEFERKQANFQLGMGLFTGPCILSHGIYVWSDFKGNVALLLCRPVVFKIGTLY